jgi:hypothetical protein
VTFVESFLPFVNLSVSKINSFQSFVISFFVKKLSLVVDDVPKKSPIENILSNKYRRTIFE